MKKQTSEDYYLASPYLYSVEFNSKKGNPMKFATLLQFLSVSAFGAGVLFGISASPARAFTFVPQEEGEINVGLGDALGGNSYLATPSLTVTSLVDNSTGTRSRLFVDKAGTTNLYGAIQFLARDAGTSEESNNYWFRPVAVKADGVTSLVEQGQLEVGTFQFDFANPVSQLVVRLFDTEWQGGTSFSVNGGGWIDVLAGENNNIRELQLNNVSSLVLNLGEHYGATGDGVNAQVAAVPEPTTMAGLALAGAGFAAMRRRRQSA
jgi:hypothetical protein